MIECQAVSKKYFTKSALKDINLKLEAGHVYGLIGPNGSGKTTFMKLLVGLHQASSGTIFFEGQALRAKTKDRIAFLPAEDIYRPSYSLKDIFNLYKSSYSSFNMDELVARCERADINIKRKVSSLSTGEKSMVRIYSTLARDVEFYIFDEPLNGLDVLAREEILVDIMNHHNENRTILISSHIIDELAQYIDHAIFLRKGEIIYDKAMSKEETSQLKDIYKEFYAL